MSMELKGLYSCIVEEQQCQIVSKTCYCLLESSKMQIYVYNFRWPACYGINSWWEGVFLGWRRWWKTWSLQSNVRIPNLYFSKRFVLNVTAQLTTTIDNNSIFNTVGIKKKCCKKTFFFPTAYTNLWCSICSRLQPFRKEAFN